MISIEKSKINGNKDDFDEMLIKKINSETLIKKKKIGDGNVDKVVVKTIKKARSTSSDGKNYKVKEKAEDGD